VSNGRAALAPGTNQPPPGYVRQREQAEAPMTIAKRASKSKEEQDRQLSEGLEESFPASDPPASTQPGAGSKATDTNPPKAAERKGK
jgi:hypothetical protein